MAINWTPARLEVDLNYKSKDIILASEWNNLWKETRLQGNNNTDGIVLLIETVEGNVTHLTNLDNLFADLESKVIAHTGNSDIHVTALQKTAWTAKYDKPSGGIPKSDLASSVQSSLDKADSALQQHQDISVLTAHVANNNVHVTADQKTTWSAKYDKPADGIPKTDLASGVQTSLNKADTALQEHQDISDLRNHVANNSVHVTADDKTAWDAKYDKPAGGIPKSDLASDVQTLLLPSPSSSDAGKMLSVDSSGNPAWTEASSSGTGGKSAYAYAVEGGYALTESDFTTDLGNLHNLPTHISNTNIHIDSAERTAWNAKAEVFTISISNDESGELVLETAYEEIVSAYNNGKLLRVSPSAMGVYFKGYLIMYTQGNFIFAFPATTTLIVINSTGATYDHAFMYLPSANTSDAGKMLMVSRSGKAVWAEDNKSNKPTFSQYTILTSGWSSGVYSFESAYPSASCDIEIELDSTATESQVEAWSSAKVTTVFGTNTMKALGDVPTVDIPVIVKAVIK